MRTIPRAVLRATILLALAATAHATIYGSIAGLVHDAQHRPISGAQVTVKSLTSGIKLTAATDDNGEFRLPAVEVGPYEVEVQAQGFTPQRQKIEVASGHALNLHFPMAVAEVKQSVEVTAEPDVIDVSTPTTQSVVTQKQIEQTPGASRTDSLKMITDYVPGAYIVHDQLHVRGGHQVQWMLDGVPVPNTSLAANVGPQFDPKDIDSIEVQRGGYSAEYGDRAYGIFNVETRSGFERDHEGELVASFGSFLSTDDQLSFGSHTERFAYYLSVNGNRSDFGLEPPVADNIHDHSAGLGTFGNFIWNKDPKDQLRLVTSVRGDHFQVPNTPEQQVAGISDVEDERDAFMDFSWLHTASNGVVVTVAPFFHFNRAHYLGGPADQPVSPEDDRALHYGGGVVNLTWATQKNTLRGGVEAYEERDNELFALTANAGNGLSLRQRQTVWGATSSVYLEDQVLPRSWLSLSAGVRLTYFSGQFTESAATPRIGASIRLPKVHWVLHGFYGRYYQPPPLETVGGPLLQLALQQGFAFLPMHGEGDEQHEVGLTVPVAKWSFDFDHFRTSARNFFDHDALGNSNIFFPVALQSARVYGWEATARSPEVFGRARFHLVFSHQYVEGKGLVTGGLTDFSVICTQYCFLDHDQRDTLAVGGQLLLPWNAWTSSDVMYGSGFLNGDGPAHLPGHVTWDIAVGKGIGERWSAQLAVLNLTDNRYLLDNSNTFGGTHFDRPREITVQLRYRFHY